jgi:DNA processing protein
MNASERLSLLALSHVLFLTPREKLLLLNTRGGAREVLSLSLQDLSRILERRMLTRTWEPDRLLAKAEQTEKLLTGGSIGCIFYTDRAYPPQLREIYDPPLTLFFRGKPPDNGKALIGIVGTRLPTGAGRAAAFSLAFGLAAAGVGVVSGLARGIDREAHEGCVEAGGWSGAVLGCGIDRIYPASSRRTAVRLLETGGALMSEYPPGAPPLKPHFPARNRIISGLCRAVVVVQAPEGSGALITAEHALDQGRDLFVHLAGTAGSAGAGARALAASGAPVVGDAAGVLREYGIPVPAGSRRDARPAGGGAGGAGAEISRLVAGEIAGECVRRGGETFWRG